MLKTPSTSALVSHTRSLIRSWNSGSVQSEPSGLTNSNSYPGQTSWPHAAAQSASTGSPAPIFVVLMVISLVLLLARNGIGPGRCWDR